MAAPIETPKSSSSALDLRSLDTTVDKNMSEPGFSSLSTSETQTPRTENTNEKPNETSSEPSQPPTPVATPAPLHHNGLPQHCPWCGRRIRSRKMVRQITRAPEGPHMTPLGHSLAVGDFLCVSSCYLAWLNSIGHFKYAI